VAWGPVPIRAAGPTSVAHPAVNPAATPAATVAASQLHGHILTPQGFVRGTLSIGADGRIAALQGTPVAEAAVREAALPLVLPGFIDTHVHGGAGADTMQAGDAVTRLAALHARHGTTSLLATTMTAPLEEIAAALRALGPAITTRPAGTARVLGVHLEGPYISPERLGAQPPFARAPLLAEILALHAIAPIRLVTLAPELEGVLALIPALADAGLRVQLGHSAASYEQTCAALAAGAAGFTHLFNAMSPLHQRAPGMVGAALAHAEHAEIIPDLLHVHPGAIRAALRAVPGLFCVTDATAAAGMPDGDYELGRHRVHKRSEWREGRCLGGVRLADGTLAGSTLTLDQALRNLVDLGLPLADASARVSTHAARFLRLHDRGVLQPGAWADLVQLDARQLQLQAVWVEGEWLEAAQPSSVAEVTAVASAAAGAAGARSSDSWDAASPAGPASPATSATAATAATVAGAPGTQGAPARAD
jgi:N-acetylglucosamine-6-phosphate deacetylase